MQRESELPDSICGQPVWRCHQAICPTEGKRDQKEEQPLSRYYSLGKDVFQGAQRAEYCQQNIVL